MIRKSALKHSFLCLLLFSLVRVEAQSYCDYLYDNTLIFGDFDDTIEDQYGGSVIQFYPSYHVGRRYKSAGQSGTHAVISDRYGNLLFHTNGCDVFDARDSIAYNGNDINPGDIHDIYCPDNYGFPSIQNIFFLPSSYDTSIFFLIYIGEIFNSNPNSNNAIINDKIYISVLSQSINNGYGGIIEKDIVILTDTNMMGSPINAVRHANGLDWWILTPHKWKNEFFLLLLDESGITYIGNQTIGLTPHRNANGGQGHFSPEGNYFAWYQPRNGLFLYDFDRVTGRLSNFKKIEIPTGADLNTGGLEFSPSGRFLYVNHYFSLYQLDMQAEDIAGSLTHIADYDGFGTPPFYTTFLYMVRTPDKRIIMNPQSGSEWLHVIQEPEKKGHACRFEQHVIELPTVNNFALPIFPNYRLGAMGEPLCDSLMVNVQNPTQILPQGCLVYPNPAPPSLTISLPQEWLKVYIYSMEGRLRYSHTYGNHNHPESIDITGWPPGMYIMQGYNEDGTSCVEKILITN